MIRGPVGFHFQKLGVQVYTSDSFTNLYEQGWASFGYSTNLTLLGAWQTNRIRSANVHMFFRGGYPGSTAIQSVPVSYGESVALQISTDNLEWTTLTTVVNKGGTITWNHHSFEEPPVYVYMRAVPADEAESASTP